MRTREERKARNERIKNEYGAVMLVSENTPYVVEVEGINGYWSTLKWHFGSQEDAERFCMNEVSGKARVIKMIEVNSHEVRCEVMFVK